MVRGATFFAVLATAFLTGLLLLLPRSAAADEFRLGSAGERLLIGPGTGEDGLWLRSWGPADHPAQDRTPRLSGLSLTDPKANGDGAGFGLGTPRAFDLLGADVGVSVGAGVSPRNHRPAPELSSAFDQAGFGGRVSLDEFSLGGAFIGSRPGPALRFGPPGNFAGGHDIDLSYAFDSGSVSLSHTQGADVLGLSEPGGEQVALTGRYLLGHNLDMTALFALEGAGDRDPAETALDGFALRAGFRLSF